MKSSVMDVEYIALLSKTVAFGIKSFGSSLETEQQEFVISLSYTLYSCVATWPL